MLEAGKTVRSKKGRKKERALRNGGEACNVFSRLNLSVFCDWVNDHLVGRPQCRGRVRAAGFIADIAKLFPCQRTVIRLSGAD
ncbi:MAG: hypothetical protein IH624_09895 [Phycisphaerae bacterium]|nr:hypothetical protein [Phycisphaerae bacterium]